ncbi:MAG: CoA transferase [Chloroflexi bacterium]|nr:CoA transferase [Chloroflexota bacterium]
MNDSQAVKGALVGVRILDFSRIWAGPHATKLLADMGAEVIKVEAIRAWDPHRMIVGSGNLPDGERGDDPWNRSGWFNTLHMSKYGITAEMRHPKGKAIIEDLVSVSDVVIENFRAGLMERRGLGYEVMRSIRPDIIMVSMPAFGSVGPWKDFIQYGIGQEQLGGIASMNGYRGEEAPVKSGVNFGDPISGAHAAGAVLSALWRRRRTGEGCFIDVSQLESAIMTIGEHLLGYQMTGRRAENRGNRHPVYAPHGAYRCSGEDAWVTIVIADDAEWARLCAVMGKPQLAEHPDYADVLSRRRNHDALDALLSEWTRDKSATDATQILQGAGVSAAPVMTGEMIFNDPHYQERELLEFVEHPSCGPYFMPGAAWKMSATPPGVRWHAPRLGEHNAQIFGELLGMAPDAIAELEAEGVSGTAPQAS